MRKSENRRRCAQLMEGLSHESDMDILAALKEGLSLESKKELLQALAKLLQSDSAGKDARFFASFGSFPNDKSAEELITEIRASRSFRDKDFTL